MFIIGPKDLYDTIKRGEWVICADFGIEDEIIIQNVYHLEDESGPLGQKFGVPILVSYCVSPSKEGNFPYRLHDDLVCPVLSMPGMLTLHNLVDGILDTYSIFFVDNQSLDTHNIFGKLGSANENTIVFRR